MYMELVTPNSDSQLFLSGKERGMWLGRDI